MSGHSKWNNIKHRKEASDAKRGKIFTKIGREIAMAIRDGGVDLIANSRLRDAIAKAKANNVPNDNINRMLAKYSGGDGTQYESITYEGYGPSGVAVIVETMTENRNRTASDMRHYFDKYGGNLGPSNCVSWQFERKGVLVIEREDLSVSEDDMMLLALDAGATAFSAEAELFEITASPEDLGAVREALEKAGYRFAVAEEQLIPQTYVALADENDVKNMTKLLELLEDNDDVQNVWHNWEE